MDGFRSRSFNDGHMQLEVYGGRVVGPPPPPPLPPPPASGYNDFRSYSTSYVSSSSSTTTYGDAGAGAYNFRDSKAKKGKEIGTSSNKGGWVFSDPEFQRKRRVASYKAYAVEGKVKGSFRRSFRWLKDRYSQVVYGWW